jgi:hypothetical protein
MKGYPLKLILQEANMKNIRYVTVFGGLVILAIAIGFILQLPVVTSIWPWPDGRLSYLFIGSILAAVSCRSLDRMDRRIWRASRWLT